ncbi:MAG: protein pafC [Actinomycetota bacterium]|nr:MAG: protein pafC [Actinomycetota bacterium]
MPSSEGLRRGSKVSERLKRLLAIVPYVVRHPGVELAELERLFHIPEEALVEDLNLLFLSGLPPYSPGDLIDVEIQDGRVWIRMADYFSRPLRLTRAEALALYLRGTALAATPGVPDAPALTSALGKLAEALGPETLGALPERTSAARGGREAAALEVLRRAAAEHRRVRIEYFAASSAEITTREIDPEEIFTALGNWYVAAFDHRSGEERLFRADRVRTVEETGETFEPRGLHGAGRPLYSPTVRDVDVRLILAPEARWVAEYYETKGQVEREDGSLEVVLPTTHLEWVERLVLRLAGAVRVLEPEELKDRVRELARRTREPYR